MASPKEGTGSVVTSSSSSTDAARKSKGKRGSREFSVRQGQEHGLVHMNTAFDEGQCQMEMMWNLHHINTDHPHVGWYQSIYYGSPGFSVLKKATTTFEYMFEEVPVVMKNLHLIKALINHLGKNLMDRVDDRSQDIDISKLFKSFQSPAKMASVLTAGQMNTLCWNIKETGQNLGKFSWLRLFKIIAKKRTSRKAVNLDSWGHKVNS
ncbi:Eukaryotic translation initiation factor 3 subunit H [Galemys pyrenaicus]|uniref:Eukaryotic translation initiation factor 3 subunit H n=1 Tax=Galemys pyrenaicus TaxID=202257 RepID=A0A8J5ZE41_GALPY|nr:Eukaryotic translation initiation factor 3 subunit H [Galemys pyrenaicus]